MADPFHHAVSASREWGGTPDQYLAIEEWFDESKVLTSDPRHRALRHHSEGIELACNIFGRAILVFLTLCDACEGTGYLAVDSFGGHGTCAQCQGHKVYKGPGHKARMVPVRWIAERHVREDMGFIPSAVDWLREIRLRPWMNRPRRLSRELDNGEGDMRPVDSQGALPGIEKASARSAALSANTSGEA